MRNRTRGQSQREPSRSASVDGLRLAGSLVLASAAFTLLWSGFESSALRSQERPLPSQEEFYEAVRSNLARADRDQYRYAYREKRSEIHTNPFGKIGTGGTVLYQVEPGEELGLYYKRAIERDGKALTNEKRETIDRRGRPQGSPTIEDVVATLDFAIVRRESAGGRDLVVVSFSPKPNAKPKTRQGKMAKVFKGNVWIDEEAKEVVRLEATAIDNLSYGLGVLARLNEGTHVKVQRERVDATTWLPTSIRMTGQGRALLFRKLNVDYFIEWFDYKRTLN
jgi:hypothetical protein